MDYLDTPQEEQVKRNWIIALAVPALSFAACSNPKAPGSPENPSAVLAVIGGAGLAWRSLRARLGK